MFEKIKRHSLERNLKKQLEKRNLTQRNTTITTLGILVEKESFDDFDFLRALVKDIGVKEQDLNLFVFHNTKTKMPTLENNSISLRDFNWRGKIKNQDALTFLEQPFDALIAIYKAPNIYLDAMVGQSKAFFKVGLEDMEATLFDLILQVATEKKDLMKQELVKYLKILNKIR